MFSAEPENKFILILGLRANLLTDDKGRKNKGRLQLLATLVTFDDIVAPKFQSTV